MHRPASTSVTSHGRWLRAQWALIALLLASLALPMSSPAPAAAGSDLTYSIGDQVTAEDEAYVREGIALAEQYVAAELTDISDEELVVNVRSTEDTTGMGSIAFAGGSYIAVFTGTEGWSTVAPFERIHVVVHEYIHAYQYYHSRTRYDYLPAWMIEGMAEYLGFDAVIRRGLVDADDVHAYNAWAVGYLGDIPPLQEMQADESFYPVYGAYNLGYLAVAHLMEGREPKELDRLLKGMRSGNGWKTVFADVFGITVAEFYESFAAEREALELPAEIPVPFAYIEPARVEGAISINVSSESVAIGNQLTMLGETEAGAMCRLRLRSRETKADVEGATFADASGRMFWLLTVPEEIGAGPATLTASCGGERASLAIEISSG